jgi:hypothetical protein
VNELEMERVRQKVLANARAAQMNKGRYLIVWTPKDCEALKELLKRTAEQ